MKDIYNVKTTRSADRDLKKVPKHIAFKLYAWIEAVGKDGLTEVMKIKSYHDEPLKGKRVGQRSIRLNRAYRAIYTIEKDGTIQFIEIQEVNKHDY